MSVASEELRLEVLQHRRIFVLVDPDELLPTIRAIAETECELVSETRCRKLRVLVIGHPSFPVADQVRGTFAPVFQVHRLVSPMLLELPEDGTKILDLPDAGQVLGDALDRLNATLQ